MSLFDTKQAATLALGGLLSVFSVTGCSGDDSTDSAATSAQADEAGADDDVTSDDTTSDTANEADESSEPDAAAEADPEPHVFALLETQPTDPGPHPLLEWNAVDGAAGYDLIVLDRSGEPYWAWSGTDTSIHLGGVENPDATGAWVFEPLTWIVTARDSDGQPLAMSSAAGLTP